MLASPEYAAVSGHVIDDPAAMATVDYSGFRPFKVLDLGAQILSDQEHAYAGLYKAGIRVDVLGFEPLTERAEDRAQADGGKDTTVIPSLVGDGREHAFHINNFDATSSIYPLNTGFTRKFLDLRDLATVRTERLGTVRLDDVIPPGEVIDFFKLDIQGAEALVLAHAPATLANVSVVHCEVLFGGIYEGQCYFSDVDACLRTHGFELIDLVTQHRGAYIVPSEASSADRLLWADAVYFRVLGAGDSADSWAYQAAVASIVYKKRTLAERIMADFVARKTM